MIEAYLPCGQLAYWEIKGMPLPKWCSYEDIMPFVMLATCNKCPELHTCKKWNKRRIRGMRKALKEFEDFGFNQS